MRGINCFVEILTSVIVAYFLDETFALPRKLSNTEAPDVARNFLRRQKVGLFAVNLCAVNQSESRNSITEMKNLYNVLSAVCKIVNRFNLGVSAVCRHKQLPLSLNVWWSLISFSFLLELSYIRYIRLYCPTRYINHC